MSGISNRLESLQKQDTYSLILFILYKLRDIPQYATLSELIYILDKDSLLKLAEYYGGLTITIPTIEEIEDVIFTLSLYNQVNIQGEDFDEAVEKMNMKESRKQTIVENYDKLLSIVEQYDIIL